MKKPLTILLLLACVTIQAQNWKKGLAVAAYHVGTVALGAVADGVGDNGNKYLSHSLHAAEIGAMLGGVLIFNPGRGDGLAYVLSYGFIRLSMFDSFYNLTRDLPLLYNGTTSRYDDVMNMIPDHGKAWIKSWSLIVGFTIPIYEMKPRKYQSYNSRKNAERCKL